MQEHHIPKLNPHTGTKACDGRFLNTIQNCGIWGYHGTGDHLSVAASVEPVEKLGCTRQKSVCCTVFSASMGLLLCISCLMQSAWNTCAIWPLDSIDRLKS